jgi:non-ribosomal peptide synthetase component E (peptide arylation enzyme)
MGAFGMSEGAGCMTRLDDKDDIVFNSIGKPCCPGDEFKVVDGSGRSLPRNTEGELMVRGPCLFTGYLNYPEENARAFTSDGFFRTGDLARIDDAGNIRITGRIKDIIIRGGENISPVEMETLIRKHPDVDDVAVVGMPDEELGERACAYIMPKRGAQLTLEGVVAFLRGKGASVLQFPERVELVDRIPMTAIGKADKKALREDIKKKMEGRE